MIAKTHADELDEIAADIARAAKLLREGYGAKFVFTPLYETRRHLGRITREIGDLAGMDRPR